MLLIVMGMVTTGCQSRVVPPGTTVIIIKSNGESTIKSEGSYVAWGRDRVYFIDSKLKSFTERMKILCTDNVNMNVDVKWLGSFNPTPDNVKVIKKQVPASPIDNGDMKGFQLSLEKFYLTAMSDIVRSTSRLIISKYATDNIRGNREKIEADIRARVIKRLEKLGYPVATTDVLLSNIDFPEEVTKQREAIKKAQLDDEKNAALAKATLSKAKRDAEIAMEKGKAQVIRAKAAAAANRAIASSITPEILMDRQLTVFSEIAHSKNKDLIIMPYTALNGNAFEQALLRKGFRR